MVNFGENWLNFGENCLDDYNNQKTIKRRLIEQTNEFLGAENFRPRRNFAESLKKIRGTLENNKMYKALNKSYSYKLF